MKYPDFTFTFFEQQLVLPKSEFRIIEQWYTRVLLMYRDEIECTPHLYFRPLNTNGKNDSSKYSLYSFSELLFECFENMPHIVSREVTETDQNIIIDSCYAFSPDEWSALNGNRFVYYEPCCDDETDAVYFYQIENSLAEELRASIAMPPLDIPLKGTLTSKIVTVSFDEYMSFI